MKQLQFLPDIERISKGQCKRPATPEFPIPRWLILEVCRDIVEVSEKPELNENSQKIGQLPGLNAVLTTDAPLFHPRDDSRLLDELNSTDWQGETTEVKNRP